MNTYLLVFRNEWQKGNEAPPQEQIDALLSKWQTWIKGLDESGNFSSTNRLLAEGKTVRSNNVVTDGPFMEAKEMIGGYVIVRAHSMEEAVSFAKQCPVLEYGGNVEIRAVMPIDADVKSGNFLHQQG